MSTVVCSESHDYVDGISMDGIAMAFRKDKARIEHPWREEFQSASISGSSFKDRVFVLSKELRDGIRQYAGENRKLCLCCTINTKSTRASDHLLASMRKPRLKYPSLSFIPGQ